ncbi:hypothetical protein AZ09_03870 [Acetobacter aceti 1023]|nr:hypothetical protein AZ09_03870 [Acetobacter aceti 1023]
MPSAALWPYCHTLALCYVAAGPFFSAFHVMVRWSRNPANGFFHALALAQTQPTRHIKPAYAHIKAGKGGPGL